MTGVKFVTVTELDKKATAIVSEVEKTGINVIIIKNGKPIARLRKINGAEKGRTETVSDLKNHSAMVISKIGKGGKNIIITRNNQPVVVLQSATEKILTINK